MTYFRFLSGNLGIYAAVDRDCPRDDARRTEKPDGSWLPKAGPKFPSAVSFWTKHGLRQYIDSGLQRWHQSVVNAPVTVIMPEQISPVLHSDDFQVICTPESIYGAITKSADDFLHEFAQTITTKR